MIVNSSVKVKSYKEKIKENTLFIFYKCPKCGAMHCFIRHGTYVRNVIYYEEGTGIVECKLEILRVKCKSCNSTHAILPYDIIPYSIYSYSYILNALYSHYVNNESVLNISKKKKISFQLIYNFIKVLNLFFERCISLLRIKNIIKDIYRLTHKELIEIIMTTFKPINFIISYFEEYRWMFLMKKYHNILPCPIYIDIWKKTKSTTHITIE